MTPRETTTDSYKSGPRQPVSVDHSYVYTMMAVAALCGAMVSFQVGAAIAKLLFPLVGAQGATALRQVIGAPILIIALRPWRRIPTRASIIPLLCYGIALGFMSLLFYLSLRTIPLGIAVALYFGGPLGISIASLRKPVDFIWVALAILGLLMLLPLRTSAYSIDPAGALLAAGAGACWAVYILAAKRLGKELGSSAAAYGAVIAMFIALPIGLAHSGMALLAPKVLSLGLALAFFSSALPGALEMFALTRMPPRAYGTLVSADPAIAALMGMALLGETLTFSQWGGIIAIASASVGTTLSLRPKAQLKPAEIGPPT